jgi:hypothetical protein
MHLAGIGLVVALSLASGAAFAQGAPPAEPNAPPSSGAAPPTTAPAAPLPRGAVSRDQFIQNAEQRAGQRAGALFDQMDTNHDGVLTPGERRAWRAQHPRPTQPSPQ